jgi:hypothetical protein
MANAWQIDIFKQTQPPMKSFILLVLFTFCTFLAIAQTSEAEADAVTQLLNVQKHEAVAKLVSVSGKDSVSFWKIYGEYEAETKPIIKSRIKLYETTARAYSKMKPALADSLAQNYFINRMEQEKRLEIYYKRIKAATNAVIAFEFYQAETYLLTQIRVGIMQQIPTYGELQRMINKKN